MTQHINPGTDTTINPVVIDDSKRSNPNKGKLVYGSITKSGEDWRMRSFDAGMGETEYRIFKNEKFFAQFDNRKDADTVMELMAGATEVQTPDRLCDDCNIIEIENKLTDTERQLIMAQQHVDAVLKELQDKMIKDRSFCEDMEVKVSGASATYYGSRAACLEHYIEAIALLQAGRK